MTTTQRLQIMEMQRELQKLGRRLADFIRDVAKPGPLRRVANVEATVKLIQLQVADYYHLTTEQLRGPCRTDALAWPRQVAMTICREFTPCTLSQIGAYFNRDHGTVLHACHRVADMCATEPKGRGADVAQLRAEIKRELMPEEAEA